MRRGTTPTRKRTYPKMLTFCEVTFKQGETQFTIAPDVTETDYGCLISFTLTQEQTLSLSVGIVYWQIRGISADGVDASEKYTEVVTDVMPDGVIEQPVTLGFFVPNETPEEPEEPEEPTEENWEDWQEREDEPALEAEEGEE